MLHGKVDLSLPWAPPDPRVPESTRNKTGQGKFSGRHAKKHHAGQDWLSGVEYKPEKTNGVKELP